LCTIFNTGVNKKDTIRKYTTLILLIIVRFIGRNKSEGDSFQTKVSGELKVVLIFIQISSNKGLKYQAENKLYDELSLISYQFTDLNNSFDIYNTKASINRYASIF